MGHASYRGIRRCRHEVSGQEVSRGTIGAVVREAQERALALVAGRAPPGARAMARDEIYGRDRQGASLNVVDVDSGAVWAAEGPLPVDGETGTLTLWAAQERGLRWRQVVSGGCVDTDVIEHAMTVLETGRPQVIEYGYSPDMTWEVGLMCGGAVQVFVEPLEPTMDGSGVLGGPVDPSWVAQLAEQAGPPACRA